jgi:SAM-dependent methyltransferase
MNRVKNERIVFFKKVLNTFFSPKIHGLISNKSFNVNQDPSRLRLFYYQITSRLWFFPSMYTSNFWVGAKKEGDRGYTTFMKIDDKALFLIEHLRGLVERKDMSILDIGCNVGRFLNVLAKDGCCNLTGIDINELAIKDSYSTYPALVNNAKMYSTTMQSFLSSSNDGSFDIIYTYGATVELIHPTFPLVKNIARVSKKYVCFFISESQAYVRFWEYEFKKNGFELLLKELYCHRNLSNDCDQVLYIFRKIEV